MEKVSNTFEVRNAVSHSAMASAMNPALIFNPAATSKDLMSWAIAELENLNGLLEIVSCSACEFQIDPKDVARTVTDRLVPLIQGLHAALESGRA